MRVFKIDKDLDYTFKTLTFFESEKFYSHIYHILNLEQFGNESKKSEVALITLDSIYQNNSKLYKLFLNGVFVHYCEMETRIEAQDTNH